MPKPKVPLTVYVTDPAMLQWPELQDQSLELLQIPDGVLVIGPQCWQMTTTLQKYVKQALKFARTLRAHKEPS